MVTILSAQCIFIAGVGIVCSGALVAPQIIISLFASIHNPRTLTFCLVIAIYELFAAVFGLVTPNGAYASVSGFVASGAICVSDWKRDSHFITAFPFASIVISYVAAALPSSAVLLPK